MRKMVKRNPMVRELRTPKYRVRVVRSKKGVKSYNRKKKNRCQLDSGSFLFMG